MERKNNLLESALGKWHTCADCEGVIRPTDICRSEPGVSLHSEGGRNFYHVKRSTCEAHNKKRLLNGAFKKGSK